MQQRKNILINNSVKKADEALNRTYYSIFYSVLGLGYYSDFITSKHNQLKGWFNKKFIHEGKIFSPLMMQIYQKSYNERQEADYQIINSKEIDAEEVKKSLNDADYFINTIQKYLNEHFLNK